MTTKPYLSLLLGSSFLLSFCGGKNDDAVITPVTTTNPPPTPVVYTFETTPTWADEFDYTGLPDDKKWGYDVGGAGWGNNEKQYYTQNRTQNARVEGGKLIIEARKEQGFGSNSYTSARLITKGKGDWKYGRIVVRAKLPKGVGTWPAIWMLATKQNYGANYWPDNGELDIMEHVGYDQNVVHATVHTFAFNHTKNTQKSANKIVPDCSEAFHDYAMEWSPAKTVFYIDDNVNYTFNREGYYGWQEFPFDQPFHLLLNIAVGGNWGGLKGIDDSVFPQRMEVDYVRVYAMKP